MSAVPASPSPSEPSQSNRLAARAAALAPAGDRKMTTLLMEADEAWRDPWCQLQGQEAASWPMPACPDDARNRERCRLDVVSLRPKAAGACLARSHAGAVVNSSGRSWAGDAYTKWGLVQFDGACDQSGPAPYGSTPPSYEDALGDAPPDYTSTDELARIWTSHERDPIMALPPPPPYTPSASPLDWTSLDGARQHGGKKKDKKAAKKAQADKWNDSDNEGKKEEGDGANGDGGGNGDEGGSGAGGAGGGGDDGGDGGGDDGKGGNNNHNDDDDHNDGAGGGKKKKKDKKKNRMSLEEEDEKQAKANADGGEGGARNNANGEDANAMNGDGNLAVPPVAAEPEVNPEDEWNFQPAKKGKKGKKGKASDPIPPPPPPAPKAPETVPDPEPEPTLAIGSTAADGFDDIGLDDNAPKLDLSFGGGGGSSWGPSWGNTASKWGFGGIGSALSQDKDKAKEKEKDKDGKSSNPWAFGGLGKTDKKLTTDTGFAAFDFGDLSGSTADAMVGGDDAAGGGQSILDDVNAGPEWPSFTTASSKKDKKQNKKALAPTEPEPTSTPAIDIPTALTTDDAFPAWATTTNKKGKKGKKDVAEPKIEDDPLAIVAPSAAAEAATTMADNEWTSYGSNKKNKKNKKGAIADSAGGMAPPPPPPEPEPFMPEVVDDGKSTDGFSTWSTKSDKKKKKGAKSSVADTESTGAKTNGITVVEDAMLDINHDLTNNTSLLDGDDWASWALPNKDQPKIAATQDTDTVNTTMFEALDSGHNTSSWNIWPSAKKDKKGKHAGAGLEPPPPVPTPPQQGLTPGSTPPPPPPFAPIDAVAPVEAGGEDWATFPPVTTKGKKGSKKAAKAEAASKPAANAKSTPGHDDDIVAVVDDARPENDNDIVAIIDAAQQDAEWPEDELDEPGSKGFWSGFGTSASKSKKEKQKEEKERLKKEKEEKLQKEKDEAERAQREQEEREEQERIEREEAEREKAEREEQEEKEREEKTRKTREKEDKERAKKEKEEREKARREEAKREREEKERAKKEKEEKERARREEAKREKDEKERARKEEAKREKEEKERAEQERKEKERQEQEEKERLEKEKELKKKEKAKGKSGKKSRETIEELEPEPEPEPQHDAAAAVAAAMLISDLDMPDDHVIGDGIDHVPDADVNPKADKAKDKEKEKERDSVWGFWGSNRKSSGKATSGSARDKGLSQPTNEPEASSTATDEAAAQAFPPVEPPADTSTTPAVPSAATKDKKRSSIADKIKAFEQPAEPFPTETRKAKGASQRGSWATSKLGASSNIGSKLAEGDTEGSKKSNKKKAEEEEREAQAEAIIDLDSLVPGSFPVEGSGGGGDNDGDENDLIAVIDEAPPPEKKASKTKKKKSAKVSKMDTVEEVVDIPIVEAPPPPPLAPEQPPTPPPEPAAPEPEPEPEPEPAPPPAPKPVKKERARVVREESSWGFWGTTKQRDSKAKERKPKNEVATPASPPKETPPAIVRSRSGRKDLPKEAAASPAQSSSSDKEKTQAARPEKRPTRSKGMTLAGFLSGTAPAPRRTISRREPSAPKVDARPKDVELDDTGLVSPPPEDELVRTQSSAKAAKILGTSEKTAAKLVRRESSKGKSKRPAVEAAPPPPPPPPLDDDVVVLDDGDDLLGDYGAPNPPPEVVSGRSRDKGKVSRHAHASGNQADGRDRGKQRPVAAADILSGADDLVMVDAPGPSDSGPEQPSQRSGDRIVSDRTRARPSPLKRSSTGTKKPEGIMGFFGSLRSKNRGADATSRRRKSGSDERPLGYGSRGVRLTGSDGDGGKVRQSSKRDSRGSGTGTGTGTGTEGRSRTDNSRDGEEAEARRAERRARRAAREAAEREAREAKEAELREAEERRARRKAAEREALEARRQKAREAKERQAREDEERAYRRQKERSAKRAREEEARREVEARDVRRRLSGRTKRREAEPDMAREGPSRPRRSDRRSSGMDRGLARGPDEDERRRARRDERRPRRGDDERARIDRRRSGPAAVGGGGGGAPIRDYFDPRNAGPSSGPYVNGIQDPGVDHTSSWLNSQMAEPPPPPPVDPTVANGEPSQPRAIDGGGGGDSHDDSARREARRSTRRSAKQVADGRAEPDAAAAEAGRSSRRRSNNKDHGGGRRTTDREGHRSSEGSDEYANNGGVSGKRRRAGRRVTTGAFPSTMATGGGGIRTFDGRPTSAGDRRGSWWKGLSARIAGV